MTTSHKLSTTSKDSITSNPKVAIIVPFYNVEKYLQDCLESCIHQSYSNIEIILIDDGSTDKSCEIAKTYFEKDSRISLICKSNGGQGSARNMGIEYISNGFTYSSIIETPYFIQKAILKPQALSANNINYLTGEQIVNNYTGGGDRKEA